MTYISLSYTCEYVINISSFTVVNKMATNLFYWGHENSTCPIIEMCVWGCRTSGHFKIY